MSLYGADTRRPSLLAQTARLVTWPWTVLLFVLGFAVFRAVRIDARDIGSCGTEFAISVCALGVMLWLDETAIAVAGGATAALIWIGYGLQLSGPALRGVAFMAAISYSLYLTHVPVGGRVVNLGRRFVSEPFAELALSLAAFAVCICFAAAFHVAVERPAIAMSRRVVAAWRPVRAS